MNIQNILPLIKNTIDRSLARIYVARNIDEKWMWPL